VRTSVARVIAVVGVAAEAIAYRKLLTDCVPYKEMTIPPARFFATFANVGGAALIAAVVIVVAFVPRRIAHRLPLASTAIAPLVYASALAIAMWSYPGPDDLAAPDFTRAAAMGDFAGIGTGLAVLAVACGAAASAALSPRYNRPP
jgi:hypothetical protein